MRKKVASRAVDGSKQLTDAERMKAIEKAYRDCGVKPSMSQLLKQFRIETGRGPGEKPKLRGSKARMW
jgi:hypothetical protein